MKKESVFLRALDMGDLERVLKWHNDAALYETLGGTYRPVNRANEAAWLRRKCVFSTSEVNLAICVAGTGAHVGNLYLRNIDPTARHGEVHLFLGDRPNRSKGYGSSALRQLVRLAFATLGLQRLYLYVLADNAAAIRTYAKCGFAVEGRLRRQAFKQGRFKDMLVMGLCRTEGTKARRHRGTKK